MNKDNDDKVDNNADADDDSNYVHHPDAVPKPTSIPMISICDIIIYPETNSVVEARPSPCQAKFIKNTTKYRNKCKRATYFQLTEQLYHLSLLVSCR